MPPSSVPDPAGTIRRKWRGRAGAGLIRLSGRVRGLSSLRRHPLVSGGTQKARQAPHPSGQGVSGLDQHECTAGVVEDRVVLGYGAGDQADPHREGYKHDCKAGREQEGEKKKVSGRRRQRRFLTAAARSQGARKEMQQGE